MNKANNIIYDLMYNKAFYYFKQKFTYEIIFNNISEHCYAKASSLDYYRIIIKKTNIVPTILHFVKTLPLRNYFLSVAERYDFVESESYFVSKIKSIIDKEEVKELEETYDNAKFLERIKDRR